MAIAGGRKCGAFALTLALTLTLGAQLAAAAEPGAEGVSEANRQAAQDAHRHALELFDRGQHSQALAEFKRAYGLAPSFRILYNIGLSQAALGDALAAVDAFSRYLREGGDRIPAPRRQEVESEVARLSKQLGWLQLDVDEAASEVSVDGELLGRGPISRQLRLNTGRHTVSVRSADGALKTQSVTLGAGEEQRVRFSGHGATTVAAPPGATAPAAATDEVPAPPATPSRDIPWLAWGITGALGASAAVTGVLALGAHSDEREVQARRGVSHAELVDARDKVRTLALATDVLLGATAVAAGVSVYLTLRPTHDEMPQTSLLLAPGSLALRHTF